MLTYLKVKAGYYKLGRQKQIICKHTVVLSLGLVFSFSSHTTNNYYLLSEPLTLNKTIIVF